MGQAQSLDDFSTGVTGFDVVGDSSPNSTPTSSNHRRLHQQQQRGIGSGGEGIGGSVSGGSSSNRSSGRVGGGGSLFGRSSSLRSLNRLVNATTITTVNSNSISNSNNNNNNNSNDYNTTTNYNVLDQITENYVSGALPSNSVLLSSTTEMVETSSEAVVYPSTTSYSSYPASPRVRRQRSIRCIQIHDDDSDEAIIDTTTAASTNRTVPIRSRNQLQHIKMNIATLPGHSSSQNHDNRNNDDNSDSTNGNNLTYIVQERNNNNNNNNNDNNNNNNSDFNSASFTSFMSEDEEDDDDDIDNRLYKDPDDVYDNDDFYESYSNEAEFISNGKKNNNINHGENKNRGRSNSNTTKSQISFLGNNNNTECDDEEDEDAMINHYYERQREIQRQQQHQQQNSDINGYPINNDIDSNANHNNSDSNKRVLFARQGSHLGRRGCDESTAGTESFISAEQDHFDDDNITRLNDKKNIRNNSVGGGSGDGSTIDADEYCTEFYPIRSLEYEWMGRSIESLYLGHISRAPILQLMDDDFLLGLGDMTDILDMEYSRRRSTASTFGGGRRRSTASTWNGGGGGGGGSGRRGSLLLSTSMQGGTLANYYSATVPARSYRGGGGAHRVTNEVVDRSNSFNGGTTTATAGTSAVAIGTGGVSGGEYYHQYQNHRRGSMVGATVPMGRRRSSMASTATPTIIGGSGVDESAPNTHRSTSVKGGPNVALKVLARELTGKTCFPRGIPETQRLYLMGGASLLNVLDKPVAGIASEVAFLAAAIDNGDWAETHTIVSRIVSRLMGDPSSSIHHNADGQRSVIDDPTLPPTAPRFYAGGGRLGLERDAFVMAGGIQVIIRIFREKSFVGQEMAYSYDARDLSSELVSTRLAACWNEALLTLRELLYAIPSLVEDGTITDDGDFLPFLFTLLSHDSCFDGAVSLIEEILSFMVQTQNQAPAVPPDVDDGLPSYSQVYGGTASMFFLGNVPNLYKLWRGFNCRQLAQFCRILALLVFEPEDRQLLESPAVLKSLELLQLRRNRAVRAGRDSTVDMNQAILLGDEELIQRLLKLVSIMNYAPPLRRFTPYHVMASFPFVADTLVMLGLHELGSWEEAERQERLAKIMLDEYCNNHDDDQHNRVDLENSEILLSELGTVVDMLEGLSNTLTVYNRQGQNQIGQIIHVISAAQQAGVIVGRNQNSRRNRRRSPSTRSLGNNSPEAVAGSGSEVSPILDGSNSVQELATVAGIFTDQIILNRLYQVGRPYASDNIGDQVSDPTEVGRRLGSVDNNTSTMTAGMRYLINTPEDAANSLQFNAMLLGPYQVEVLFVLCTLLGGRRKMDAQDMLKDFGVISVLDGMFQRLPWYRRSSLQGRTNDDNETADNDDDNNSSNNSNNAREQGIHGPGCECTPESALCVQYLRMVHNFCDRDCDNYPGRRLLLSESERHLVFHGTRDPTPQTVKPGLLTKIIGSFIRESDESPYRFWLASCIESYLRGSSQAEQLFVARSGLLSHLVEEISSDRLHCAGSLQTSFDLLGELGKGNTEVICLLVDGLAEERFRKLMSVAAANLVDSNVFIRSLFLTLERMSAQDGILPLYMDTANLSIPVVSPWTSPIGSSTHSYLTHSWWDTPTLSLFDSDSKDSTRSESKVYDFDEGRPSDWFPPCELVELNNPTTPLVLTTLPRGLTESVGHFGWVFMPVGDGLTEGVFLPNTVDRMSWFLAANQARLLRDLLRVVDLRNINHENICCLNTAVIIAIFAHRRKQLALLLQELRTMNDEEKETKRRALSAERRHDDVVDRAFVQAMLYLDLDHQNQPYTRRASLGTPGSSSYNNYNNANNGTGSHSDIGDRTDVMRNFREVLWFWMEYYTHRGRDRLSLEFSSHIRFNEWNNVVALLSADDGSPTSLVRSPVRLPISPYQRAARVADNPIRGE